jgi:O-antigen ligase
MILTVILPIALHRAFAAQGGSARRRAWLMAALIGVGIPLSISRSAVVAIVMAAIVLLPGWPVGRRWATIKVLPVFLVLIRLLAPGTLGTLKSGLLGIANDPSVRGRTEDYAVVGRFISEGPFFGRGFATFLPDRYVLLDNQYIGVVVELGFVGLAVVVALFLSGLTMALVLRGRGTDDGTCDLALSLAASVAAAAAGMATFDALGFASITGLTFLVFGCIGALWRLTPHARLVTGAAATGHPTR